MKRSGNGRRDKRSFGSKHAVYEVDFSLRAFCEIMFLAPPMGIYLRTNEAQPDSWAKVRARQQLAGSGVLQREKVITVELEKEVRYASVVRLLCQSLPVLDSLRPADGARQATPAEHKHPPYLSVRYASLWQSLRLLLMLGFSSKEKELRHSGVHMYWKNILVIPYFCSEIQFMEDGVIGIANVQQPCSLACVAGASRWFRHRLSVSQVDFLLANAQKEDFEKAMLQDVDHGERWDNFIQAMRKEVCHRGSHLLGRTDCSLSGTDCSSITHAQVTKYIDQHVVAAGSDRDGFMRTENAGETDEGTECEWAQCERCSLWRRLPPGGKVNELDYWECGQPPLSDIFCNMSRDEDNYDGAQEVVQIARSQGETLSATQPSDGSSEIISGDAWMYDHVCMAASDHLKRNDWCARVPLSIEGICISTQRVRSLTHSISPFILLSGSCACS